MSCNTTDFLYPLLADIYYPITEQTAYGNMKKQWILDKTIACNFTSGSRKGKQDVQMTEAKIDIDTAIIGRSRCDITISNQEKLYSLTNIVITNIRDVNGNIIYNESSGPRSGRATLFEVATMNPIVGPFGSVEYYRLVIRRSDNQAVDL